MAIAIKGIFRGLKIIAQIFTVQREHEIEIGYPTDVRHVSHIGLGASDSCPSWMNEFRGVEEVTAGGGASGASIMSSAAQSRQTSWASLDFEQPATEACTDGTPRSGDGRVTVKKAATRAREARAPSAGSVSWRSTASASFATACGGDSGELCVIPTAALQAA